MGEEDREGRSSGGSGSLPSDRERAARRILSLASPRQVLAGLLDGDPLGVHLGTWRRLEELALLLDHAAVSRRAFARVARAGPSYRGEPPLAVWLRDRFDHSLREVQEEDIESELQGLAIDPRDHRLQLLASNFGLEPGLTRRAAIRFNGLPLRVRSTFFRVALQGRTLFEYATEADVPYDQAWEDVELAYRTLSAPAHPDGYDLPDFPEETW